MYYEKGVITVDRDFARFGSKSYAINKINTVEILEKPAANQAGIGCGIAILALFALGCLLALADGFNVVTLIIGFFAIAGIFGLARLLGKKDYQLLLRTSSGEAREFSSAMRSDVEQLRDAIEQAMAGR